METMTESIPLLGQGLVFEDMTVGTVFRTAHRTITETDLMSFVHLGGFNLEGNVLERGSGAEAFAHTCHSQPGRHSFRY